MTGHQLEMESRRTRRCAFAAAISFLALAMAPGLGTAAGSPERGKTVFDAGGCYACHTDIKGNGPPLAGGPGLKTPFGTFFAPNITPDPKHGIGGWTEQQFLRAMRDGIGPDGKIYYPVFPYTAYTKATEQDLLDLWAYLMSLAPVAAESRPHDVGFPFSVRLALLPWRWLNFAAGPWKPAPAKDAVWNRGAYLVEALSHCGECHTPRDFLGGLDRSRWLAGSRDGPPGEIGPNLTPHATGLAEWSEGDIALALETGLTLDAGVGGSMGEVVRFSTSRLSAEDRRAIARYLKDLPPLPTAAKKK